LTRGAIVVAAARGAYTGKPRPAVVVQSDLFNPTHASLTVCPVTSDCVDAPLFRLPLPAGGRTWLKFRRR
jgi:mRNA interferase MazF